MFNFFRRKAIPLLNQPPDPLPSDPPSDDQRPTYKEDYKMDVLSVEELLQIKQATIEERIQAKYSRMLAWFDIAARDAAVKNPREFHASTAIGIDDIDVLHQLYNRVKPELEEKGFTVAFDHYKNLNSASIVVSW